MSLTEAHEVFASVHEDALNDLLTAFCTDRPRYLVYGSPGFVPATTVAETTMPAIAFPGVPGGFSGACSCRFLKSICTTRPFRCHQS